MPVYRSIRVQLPDRPGALSSISAALAARRVDIVRLDIVSHEGATAIDDLFVVAASQQDIGEAIASFPAEVVVRTFDHAAGDPALEMGLALAATAGADSADAGRDAAVKGAREIARADVAALLRANRDAGFDVLAGPEALASVPGSARFAGRRCLQRGTAIAFPVAPGWAPEDFQAALGGAWVAMAPCGPMDLLLVGRQLNIAYYSGELERLSAFAHAVGAIMELRGDRASSRSIPAGAEEPLPARGISLDSRLSLAR